ncbi:MAG: helix-turn-helix transcriptional regulator [Nevskia sp.]|nr:helix-turn-helix transcriptional regulator [Nevskia sp.]
MFKISIKPAWQLELADGTHPLPQLVNLLVHVRESGTLAAACHRLGMSYRHGWGLLREGRRLFGVPLAKMERGRGAVLTPLGEKLVWADKRISARLSPMLDSLASELEVEVERALTDVRSILHLHVSHGFAVETLREWLAREQVPIDLKYRNSQEVLISLAHGNCDLASFHVPVGEFQSAALHHYRRWLRPASQRLILLATRRQGLMLARGNPKRIHSIADLARKDVTFVNRQPGSGTRLLFDLLIEQAGLDREAIRGYDNSEFTHAAVAAYVASGMADAGLGVETAARRFDLDFRHIATERFFFICAAKTLSQPMLGRVLEILRSDGFRRAVNQLAGYDAQGCGTVCTLTEALPELAGPRHAVA